MPPTPPFLDVLFCLFVFLGCLVRFVAMLGVIFLIFVVFLLKCVCFLDFLMVLGGPRHPWDSKNRAKTWEGCQKSMFRDFLNNFVFETTLGSSLARFGGHFGDSWGPGRCLERLLAAKRPSQVEKNRNKMMV